MHRIAFALGLASTITLSTTSSGAVLVVDANSGSGSQFTGIAQALGSAANGDLILVRSGSYAGFDVAGLGVTILADAGATVQIGTPASITGTAAGDVVVIRGLEFAPFANCSDPKARALLVSSAAGSVTLEDCSFAQGTPTVDVVNCAAVQLVRCTCIGGGLVFDCFGAGYSSPGAGLRCTASHVFVQSSTFVGKPGKHAAYSAVIPGAIQGGDPGAPGIDVVSGTVFVSGSTAIGGNGGNGLFDALSPFPTCVGPGLGGAGLRIGSTATASVLDCALAAGGTGLPGTGCPHGTVTPAVVLVGGASLTSIGGRTNELVAPSPVREATASNLTLTGPPGASVVLFASPVPATTYVSAAESYLYAQLAPAFVLGLGTVPLSGTLTLPYTVPSGLPPQAFASVWVQCVTCPASPAPCRFGSPSMQTMLDASL